MLKYNELAGKPEQWERVKRQAMRRAHVERSKMMHKIIGWISGRLKKTIGSVRMSAKTQLSKGVRHVKDSFSNTIKPSGVRKKKHYFSLAKQKLDDLPLVKGGRKHVISYSKLTRGFSKSVSTRPHREIEQTAPLYLCFHEIKAQDYLLPKPKREFVCKQQT